MNSNIPERMCMFTVSRSRTGQDVFHFGSFWWPYIFFFTSALTGKLSRAPSDRAWPYLHVLVEVSGDRDETCSSAVCSYPAGCWELTLEGAGHPCCLWHAEFGHSLNMNWTFLHVSFDVFVVLLTFSRLICGQWNICKTCCWLLNAVLQTWTAVPYSSKFFELFCFILIIWIGISSFSDEDLVRPPGTFSYPRLFSYMSGVTLNHKQVCSPGLHA